MINAHFVTRLFVVFLFFLSSVSVSQIKSGNYEQGLNIAFNPSNNLVTAYFESYTGYDEETKTSKFSCIFYIYGFYKDNKIEIISYYPLDRYQNDEIINGEIKVVNDSEVKIKLKEEHGGCWNVQHFADDFESFKLEKTQIWKEIRYVNTDKAYFYKTKSEESKRKAFLLKGDIIYIDKIEDNWIHCKYYGKKITEGWLKIESVNNN